MGNVLTSWMGQFGSKVMSMLPKGFANTLGTIGTSIKNAASFAYDNTIGAVYNTVSKALTAGIDMVTKPFMAPGSEGLATSFKNFVSDTATNLGGTPTTDIPTEPGVDLPKDLSIEDQKKITASRKESFAKLQKEQPASTTTIDTPEIKEPGIFKKGVDKLSEFKKGVGDTKILGTGVEVREAASVAKDASGVFTAYKYFNPDNVEGAFYNPNIPMANQLNQPNDPYTTGSVDATFIPMNSSSNINSAANAYAGIFGNPGTDPVNTAIGAPGYGLTFADYATGGTIYG
jgi:hypothetical protein